MKIYVDCSECRGSSRPDGRKCCEGGHADIYSGIYLTKREVRDIETFSKRRAEDFSESIWNHYLKRNIISLRFPCIFYEKRNGCSIHPVKPLMCEIFPFHIDPLTFSITLDYGYCQNIVRLEDGKVNQNIPTNHIIDTDKYTDKIKKWLDKFWS